MRLIRQIRLMLRWLRQRKTRRKALYVLLVLLVVLGSFAFWRFSSPKEAEAAWWDDSWAYRKAISIPSHTSAENNVYVTVPAFDATDTSRFQSDCGDLRFTKQNGELLPYYVVDCDATANIHVQFDTLPAGASTYYMYYGNPSAPNGTEAADFATAASGLGAQTAGSEEKGPGPISYWNFDDASGTSAQDGTLQNNDLTITNATWKTEDLCVSGKCLGFDGNADYATKSYSSDTELLPGTGSFTVSAWFRHTSTAGADTLISRIDAVAGVGWKVYMNSSGFMCFGIDDTAGTFPADSACGSTSLADSQWHYITAVKSGTSTITLFIDGRQITQTAVTATLTLNGTNSPFTVGNDFDNGTNGWDGFIDDVKYYNFAKTAAQIQIEFASRGTSKGVSAQFGDPDQQNYLSNGLVGYWKMDETSWTSDCATGSVIDHSGNTNPQKICPNGSAQSPVAGKFGKGVTFNGTSQYFTNNATATQTLGQIDFTMSTWIKYTSTAFATAMTWRSNDAGAGGLTKVQGIFTINRATTDGRLEFETWAWQDTNTRSYSTNPINDGTWHMATAVYTASDNTAHLYVDGVLNDTKSQGTAYTPNTSQNFLVTLGANISQIQYFPGSMDDVRIYNRALSPAEVASLYNWAPDPVGYWKLDENTGTTSVNDSSGNGNTGTITNFTNWKPGRFGSALEFNGSNTKVNVGSPVVLDSLKNTGMTAEAWIYPRSVHANNSKIFSKTNTSDGSRWDWHMSAGNTNMSFQHDCTPTSDLVASTGNVLTLNTWQHVAVTWTGSTSGTSVTFYLNGVSTPISGSPTDCVTTFEDDSSNDLSIGDTNASGTRRPFDGFIDEAKVYNYVRTAKQIVEDMNAGHPAGGSPVGSQPVYWKFDEGQGTSTANNSGTDSSSNGNLISFSSPATATSGWTFNGKVNKALVFDGTGDRVYISSGNDAAVDFNTTEQFSASAWVYPTTMAGSSEMDGIITKWDATSALRGYRLVLTDDDADTTGNFRVEVYDESADQTISAAGANDSVAVNTWYHVMFTFNGGIAGAAGDLKLYVNGQLVSSSAANASFLGLEDIAADFTVGDHDATDVVAANTSFTGTIDEVKVYSGLLTQSEILVDMNAGSSAAMGGVLGAQDNEGFGGNPPVGWWKMDENGGIYAYDSSGNGYSTTLTGGPTWTSGKIGAGIEFDGSDDYVTAPSQGPLPNNNITVEAWVKLYALATDIGNDQMIVFKNNSGGLGDAYEIEQQDYTGEDRFYFYWRDSVGTLYSARTTASTLAIQKNVWYHLAGVRNGANIYMYVNGSDKTGATTPPDAGDTIYTNNPDVIRFGARSAISTRLKGVMDNVVVFDYARTPAQIAYDYNRGAPVAWYKFDECQGTTAYNAAPAASGLAAGMNGTITPGGAPNTAVGTCNSGDSAHMWNDGATGKYNSSLDFDGTDDYVTIADNANLDFTDTDDLMISGWFNRDTFTSDHVIVAKRNGIANTDQGYIVYIDDATDKLTFEVSDATDEYQLESTTTFTSTGWNHFTVVWDQDSAANSEIYINGRDDNATDTGTIGNIGDLSNALTLRLGSESDGANYFDGKLDNIQLYRYAVAESNLDIIRRFYTENSAQRFGPLTGSP